MQLIEGIWLHGRRARLPGRSLLNSLGPHAHQERSGIDHNLRVILNALGEANQEGVSVWNRGNVLVGVSGIWHGAKEWKDVTVDLGLLVSNDGVRFRQPAYEWTFLNRGEDGAWDQGGLFQGQGFENVGDQTCIYYGAWDPRNWQGSPPRGGVGT